MQSWLYPSRFGSGLLRRSSRATKCGDYYSHGRIPTHKYQWRVLLSPKHPKSRRPRGMVVNPGTEPLRLYKPIQTEPSQEGSSTVSAGAEPPVLRGPRPLQLWRAGAITSNRWRRLIKKRPSPSMVLARWLDMESSLECKFERQLYWSRLQRYLSAWSPANILLEHLHRSTYPDDPWLSESYKEQAAIRLQDKGMTVHDVERWAWVISAQSADEMAERFLSLESAKPTFLFLEVLRRDIQYVRTLRLLIGHAWSVYGRSLGSDLVKEIHADLKPVAVADGLTIVLIGRLLRQARRIWPQAMVSIAHLFGPIISMVQSRRGNLEHLEPRMHARLCGIYNVMIHTLRLPAAIKPFSSMRYNWRAQRVLLGLGKTTNPPLILNRASYRAAVAVLAATRKSEKESKVASLRARSWPPWRIDQDGMDAQRSPEEDLSRSLSAANQAQESGYAESCGDRAVKILGGQEPDGTPTIHTRAMVTRLSHDTDVAMWTARIKATRDIQEAWSAFRSFEKKRGRRQTPGMYLAMLEKLEYHEARLGRKWRQEPLPGDGKEVLMPSNDNVSTFYQKRLSPPTFDELYDQMIRTGSRPSGRLLSFLIEHASTVRHGVRYLHDSELGIPLVAFLTGCKETPPAVLKKLHTTTFVAFIVFLSRFARRAVLKEKVSPGADEILPEAAEAPPEADEAPDEAPPEADEAPPEADDVPPEADEAAEHERREGLTQVENAKQRYTIVWPGARTGLPENLLLHCVELLRRSQTSSRPAWYALFTALSRDDIVVDNNLVGNPRHHLVSWQVLSAALGDFHRAGLELDPRGFQLICRGLEKTLIASAKVSLPEKMAVFAGSPVTLITDEFAKLSESTESEMPYHLPQLLHEIAGVHIHAYVRVLGLIEDHEGIIRLLKWMRRHYEALLDTASQSQGGRTMLRRVFIAARIFLRGTGHETQAERIVDSVEEWGGWPSEYEARAYLHFKQE